MGQCLGRCYGSTTPLPLDRATAAWDEEFALTGSRLGLKTADAVYWIVPAIAVWGRAPAVAADAVPSLNRWDEALASWTRAGDDVTGSQRIRTEGELP
jgi:hypothetical protein